MKNKLVVNYICEVNYPNSSAYGIHVLKMCDAISNRNPIVNLYAPNISILKKKLKNIYKIKNNINFISIFNKKNNLNFYQRVIFSLKILKHKNYRINRNNEENFYLSRSVVFALVGSVLNKKIILELHHELSGLTKFLFFFLKKTQYLNNLKYIFIHKNLVRVFKPLKNSYICLDDAVNLNDFKKTKSNYKAKTCIYVGSFHKGKGVEKILKLAKKLKNIKFHLYGDKRFLNEKLNISNLKIFNHIPYKKIPNVLSRYDVALMPYENRVSGRLKNINLVNYMSPLKMFDYLASSKIILASDLKVYNHILKHNYNSILIKDHIDNWIFWITKIFSSKKKFNHLKNNAKKTAKNFTWQKRSKKILDFAKKNSLI